MTKPIRHPLAVLDLLIRSGPLTQPDLAKKLALRGAKSRRRISMILQTMQRNAAVSLDRWNRWHGNECGRKWATAYKWKPKAQDHGRAVLTWDQVDAMRALAGKGFGPRELATMFPTSENNISMILSGRRWRRKSR